MEQANIMLWFFFYFPRSPFLFDRFCISDFRSRIVMIALTGRSQVCQHIETKKEKTSINLQKIAHGFTLDMRGPCGEVPEMIIQTCTITLTTRLAGCAKKSLGSFRPWSYGQARGKFLNHNMRDTSKSNSMAVNHYTRGKNP